MRLIGFIAEGAQIRQILDHARGRYQAKAHTSARGPALWKTYAALKGKANALRVSDACCIHGTLKLLCQKYIFGANLPAIGNCCANGKGLDKLTAAQRSHSSFETLEVIVSLFLPKSR
jgi:hypothetical protein